MLTAEDLADLAEDAARRPVSGPGAPVRSITGSARPAESAPPDESTLSVESVSVESVSVESVSVESTMSGELTRPVETGWSDGGWPEYPMGDYKSPSGSGYGSSSSRANPVAAAAESVTSFAELATLLSNGQITTPLDPVSADEPTAIDEPEAIDEPVSAQEPAAVDEPVTITEFAAFPGDAGPRGAGDAEAAGPDTAKTALPIDGYDGLSLASLRARLRNLDAGQLRVLIDHERSQANRVDVVTMFERRIVKLTDDSA
jgi:hypothetical protein